MPRPISILLLASLAACGSVAEYRVQATVLSPSYRMPVDLWVRDRCGASTGYLLRWDTLLWPVDAVISAYWGCRALADPDLAIRGGPGGVLAAMLFPYCTTHFPDSGLSLDQDLPAKWKGCALPNPSLLPVTDEAVESWLGGELSLAALVARGVGESYRKYIRRHEAWDDFHRAQQVVFEVLDGRIPVSQAGGLVVLHPEK